MRRKYPRYVAYIWTHPSYSSHSCEQTLAEDLRRNMLGFSDFGGNFPNFGKTPKLPFRVSWLYVTSPIRLLSLALKTHQCGKNGSTVLPLHVLCVLGLKWLNFQVSCWPLDIPRHRGGSESLSHSLGEL